MFGRIKRLGICCVPLLLAALSGCVMVEPMADPGAMADTAMDAAADTATDTVADSPASMRVMAEEVKTHASRGDVTVVADAKAQLMHSDGGVMMSFETSELTPGNVYTAWWVFINNPDGCETIPCTPKDVLGNSDVVVSDLGYADGLIADEDGHGHFTVFQSLGELSNAWIGNGFQNLGGAEIHVILNEHGPVVPEMVDNMLGSYRGGCTDESLPPPFPDTAKADGTPGPNPCQLFQFAIFAPQQAELEIADAATQEVSTHASRGDVTVVEGGQAQIVRGDDGLFMSFETTELTPGNVYTAWWVFINDPAECETIPCTPKDVLGNSEAVVSDLGYADGHGRFAAFQPLGGSVECLARQWLSQPRGCRSTRDSE